MSEIELRPYTDADRETWDRLARDGRNACLLFERDFMDYHRDRYADASWVAWRGARPVALLPANRVESAGSRRLISHGGLTFGGWVLDESLGAVDVIGLFEVLVPRLREAGYDQLSYRPMPHIFHRLPSEDDLYALMRLGARLVRIDLAHTIDLERRPGLARGRRFALARARKAGVQVRKSENWSAFWDILTDLLRTRHGVSPTHGLAEIERLAAAFPQRIRLHGAYLDDRLLAGAVSFDYGSALHAQYLGASPAGREVGALDAVVCHLIDEDAPARRWLSLGASTHDQGRQLNEGLSAQKEMFGARATVLTHFALDLARTESAS